MVKLLQGDCLEVMREIPDGSIDMVLTDPPYGTTACKWDTVIDLPLMWVQLKRIIKPNEAIVMTATPPFTSALGASCMPMLRYSWAWHKAHTGQLNAKRMPLRNVEDVLVFYAAQPTYNPQFTEGEPYSVTRKAYKGSAAYGQQKDHVATSAGRRYPMRDLHFRTERGAELVHPTQKPVALMEYLIRTYTNAGDTVLDFTMGSGTTGVACVNTGRAFIGIELDADYFKIASDRLRMALTGTQRQA